MFMHGVNKVLNSRNPGKCDAAPKSFSTIRLWTVKITRSLDGLRHVSKNVGAKVSIWLRGWNNGISDEEEIFSTREKLYIKLFYFYKVYFLKKSLLRRTIFYVTYFLQKDVSRCLIDLIIKKEYEQKSLLLLQKMILKQ